jgi:hypothetical protein
VIDVSWVFVATGRRADVPGSAGIIAALSVKRGSVDGAVMLEVLEPLLPGLAEAGLGELAWKIRSGGPSVLS